METHSLYILKAFSDYDLQITKKKNLIIWESVLIHTWFVWDNSVYLYPKANMEVIPLLFYRKVHIFK